MQGALAEGVDCFVVRAKLVVHDDTAAIAHGEAGLAGELVAGSNSRGDDHELAIERLAVGELDALGPRIAEDALSRTAEVNIDAERANAAGEQPGARAVELPWHEPWRKLDDVRLQPEVADGLGRLESEQTAAEHDGALRACGVLANRVEILDGAVDEHTRLVDAGDGRHEGHGPRGENQHVVRDPLAARRLNGALLAVNAHGAFAEQQTNLALLVPVERCE